MLWLSISSRVPIISITSSLAGVDTNIQPHLYVHCEHPDIKYDGVQEQISLLLQSSRTLFGGRRIVAISMWPSRLLICRSGSAHHWKYLEGAISVLGQQKSTFVGLCSVIGIIRHAVAGMTRFEFWSSMARCPLSWDIYTLTIIHLSQIVRYYITAPYTTSRMYCFIKRSIKQLSDVG